jgi:hypothetical protein
MRDGAASPTFAGDNDMGEYRKTFSGWAKALVRLYTETTRNKRFGLVLDRPAAPRE